MGNPKVGVLALQGDVVDHGRALEAVGADVTFVRRTSELDAVEALVLPGGESTAMSNLLTAFDLLEPISKRLHDGMPAFGSCAGMIMLASHVVDGREDQKSFAAIEMTVRRNAFGRQVDSFETDVDLVGIDGGPYRTVFIRAPWVEKVGATVDVIGRVADGREEERVVAVRSGNHIATAFHPEVTGDLRVHDYFVQLVRSAR